MLVSFKKFVFSITFNFFLFLFLILSIQNSSNKSKVYFLNSETVKLPISFIFGVSFITGSVIGGFTNFINQKNDSLNRN